MKTKAAIAGILALFAVASASAQQFPTVPDRTVIGRIGVGGQSGPSQAIPFGTLTTNLFTLTGIDANFLNAQSANYTAGSADCSKTITLGGNSQFTLTVGAASGFPATCSIVVQNIDGFASGRAKNIAINGLSFGNGGRLYPGQTFALKREDNIWVVTYAPGRWIWSNNKTVFVDFALGSDSNDGLASGTGAYKNINTAVNDACNFFDLNARKLTVQLADSVNYANVVLCDLPGAVPNNSGNGPVIQGNMTTPANVVLLGPSNTSPVLGVNSHTGWMIQGISLQQTGGNAPLIEADINSLVYLGDKLIFSNNGINAQSMVALYHGKIEAQCPTGCAWTVGGAASFFLGAADGQFLTNGSITITIPAGAIFGNGIFNLSRGATAEWSSITWSGVVTATTPPYICTSNAILNANGTSGAIPSAGAVGTQTNGCAVDGIVTMNASNITSGTLAAARMAAFGSGDVSFATAGGLGTIAANAVTNAKAAQMAANTFKCNNTGGTANATDCTVPQASALFTKPTVQIFSSGTDATYTAGANVTWLEIEMQGGGGGGAGSGTTAGAGGAGGNTCWKASGTACTTPLYQATGGGAGQTGTFATGGGVAGSASCSDSMIGGTGGAATGATTTAGGMGGVSRYGGAGPNGPAAGAGQPAVANSGSGGGGAGDSANANTGGGGGAGGWCLIILPSPSATYVYTIGAAGTLGAAGTGGSVGGAGGAGKIRVIEHYN